MAALKVVVDWKGRAREVTGWRKWAITIPAIPVVSLVAAFALVLLLGVAVTAVAILMIAVQVALVLALIWFMFGRYEVRTTDDLAE
jgi:hypothetical protein